MRFFATSPRLSVAAPLAQLVGLACAPILTRLYTPEEFGLLGIFMAVSAVAATIATLRYDVAVVLPKEDASAWSLLRLAGSWTIVAVLLALIVLYPLRYSLAELVDAPGLARYFVWLPLLVLTSGWLSLATHWAIRKNRFRALSTTAVSTCVLGNGYKIGGGLMGFGGGVLIVGTFIQQATCTLPSWPFSCVKRFLPSPMILPRHGLKPASTRASRATGCRKMGLIHLRCNYRT